MRSILLAGLVALGLMGGTVAPVAAQDAGRTMIIMDGSGSMWGRIGKQPKLKIAKRAVNQFLKRLPDDIEVGLMAYGHRREGDCDDIQVLVKPGEATDRKINKALAGMKFLGKTPIADSLREAAEALDYEDEAATIILVTDGTESCRANPCDMAADLESDGYDFTVHVVGFGLKPAEGRRLTCIANRTGGKYYPAKNARALARALEAAMTGEDTAESEEFAETEPEAGPANGVESPAEPAVEAEPIPGVAYYRGAPVMLNMVLNRVGNNGIVAQSPRAQSFQADGQIGDCQAICEGEPLCAAWRYDPKGATSAGTAICTMFDYAAALDYADVDPTAGYASGMKVAAVQLVRPYVPAPVVAVADAEQASQPVMVTVTPTDGPEGLSIFWQAIPLKDPEGFGIAGEGTVTGAWQVELAPGEYAIEGTAEGWFFEGYILVSPDATAFEVAGLALGEEVAMTDDVAEIDDGLTEEMGEETSPETEEPVETTNTQPINEPEPPAEEPVVAKPVTVVTVDPAQTLALAGVGTVSAAGYRCDADQPCGFQNAETGLVFALPVGWGSDSPTPAPEAEGQPTDLLAMTFFGPEAEDGSLPTLLLNPLGWTATNGDCVETGAGALCAWGQSNPVLQAGIDLIAPSLTVAAVATEVVEPEVVEPEATVTEPAATEGPGESAETHETSSGSAANEPTTPTGPSADPGKTNPVTESKEPLATEGAATEDAPQMVPPAPGTAAPTDGNWSGKAEPVVVTQCPAGFDKAMYPILANLTAARPVTWGGMFDPNALGLPGVIWQATESQATGDAPPSPVEGQPAFIMGMLSGTATMVDADNVTGELAMTFFADGYGTVGLLNAGLQSCRVTASFALTRGN
ncbi:vWA domain-containing protein [Neogemmobacter tilapiae]|uniref:VWFA domain-containing protein n=1 Tax=Neogemmobacter tilapiae TaxID=875041 RepID=A0A918TL71_9RHOB|nr:VWA domain-containing protein [Gemmobacter tilapiae]GHC46868.1 hypothetical protein GCM10007315_05820 [Gemmobacter tilapiae]